MTSWKAASPMRSEAQPSMPEVSHRRPARRSLRRRACAQLLLFRFRLPGDRAKRGRGLHCQLVCGVPPIASAGHGVAARPARRNAADGLGRTSDKQTVPDSGWSSRERWRQPRRREQLFRPRAKKAMRSPSRWRERKDRSGSGCGACGHLGRSA